MWCLYASAFAADPVVEAPAFGHLRVDARVPVELLVDGHRLAELVLPAELRVEVPAGSRVLRAYINGTPQDMTIDVPSEGEMVVIIGRTGLTAGVAGVAAPSAPVGPVLVEIRVVGSEPIQVRVDRQKLQVGVGDTASVTLTPGAHEVSIRNSAGTVIWATGTLDVEGTAPMILQIAEGRAPEISGPGGFHPGGS